MYRWGQHWAGSSGGAGWGRTRGLYRGSTHPCQVEYTHRHGVCIPWWVSPTLLPPLKEPLLGPRWLNAPGSHPCGGLNARRHGPVATVSHIYLFFYWLLVTIGFRSRGHPMMAALFVNLLNRILGTVVGRKEFKRVSYFEEDWKPRFLFISRLKENCCEIIIIVRLETVGPHYRQTLSEELGSPTHAAGTCMWLKINIGILQLVMPKLVSSCIVLHSNNTAVENL